MVASMESVYSSDRGGLTALVSQTDVGKLSDRELDDRLAALGRERCRVEAHDPLSRASGICPVADSRSARSWPTELPGGGQVF